MGWQVNTDTERLPYCGGTDAAAIVCSTLGIPYYRSAWEVWAERNAPEAVPTPDAGLQHVLDLGNALEPYVLTRYAAHLAEQDPTLTVRPGRRVHAPGDRSWLRGQLDATVYRDLGMVGICDAKTSRQRHHWIEYDADDQRVETFPAGYEVQVRTYMGLARLAGAPVEWADLAALDLLSTALYVRRIVHDEAQWGGILSIVIPWWERHIIGGERPDDDHGEVCQRWHLYCRPVERTAAHADPEQATRMSDWIEADRAAKAAAAAADIARGAVLADLTAAGTERLYLTTSQAGPYVQRQRAGKGGMTVRHYRFPDPTPED